MFTPDAEWVADPERVRTVRGCTVRPSTAGTCAVTVMGTDLPDDIGMMSSDNDRMNATDSLFRSIEGNTVNKRVIKT